MKPIPETRTVRLTMHPKGQLRITHTRTPEILVVQGVWVCEYVNICPYLGHEYMTQNPLQVFCTRSHKNMFWKKNNDPVKS